jgi:hypothetical protein
LRYDPNKLNDFFASTTARTLSNNTDTPQYLAEFVDNLPDDTEGLFKLREVSYGEVLRTIKTLRSDTSTGPDGIPVKFAKLVAEFISGPIAAIINNCIRTGYFPEAWKKARISPIPKIDNPKLEEHLRPISILPALSKVFEKLVAAQMTSFCENESVLGATISGFRKGHSTATVLMGIRDDFLKAMKKGEVTLMMMADFTNAFDTVHYKTLIAKLSSLGFSKTFLRWLIN